MTIAYLIQTAASAAAILALAGLAWRFGVARHPEVLTKDQARALLAQEFPGLTFGPIWLAPDGCSALARSQDEALILYAVGDGHLARAVPWAVLTEGQTKGAKVVVRMPDRTAPRAAFAVEPGAVWPPALDA
jgi:hypothetical protein